MSEGEVSTMVNTPLLGPTGHSPSLLHLPTFPVPLLLVPLLPIIRVLLLCTTICLTLLDHKQMNGSTGLNRCGLGPNELRLWEMFPPMCRRTSSLWLIRVAKRSGLCPLPPWSNPFERFQSSPSKISPTSFRKRSSGATLWIDFHHFITLSFLLPTIYFHFHDDILSDCCTVYPAVF